MKPVVNPKFQRIVNKITLTQQKYNKALKQNVFLWNEIMYTKEKKSKLTLNLSNSRKTLSNESDTVKYKMLVEHYIDLQLEHENLNNVQKQLLNEYNSNERMLIESKIELQKSLKTFDKYIDSNVTNNQEK